MGFDDMNNKRIDKSILSNFVKEYLEINRLKKEEQKNDTNRKQISEEINKRYIRLKEMLNLFDEDLVKKNSNYYFANYISDYYKIIMLMLMLANENKNDYTVKKFNVEQHGITNSDDSRVLKGDVFAIGKRNILERVDDSKSYQGTSFSKLATNILGNGSSLAIVTNHFYEVNVLPDFWQYDAKVVEFNVKDLSYYFGCFTFDDELGNAVNMVERYIEEYGGNIENIDLDTLYERVHRLNNQKTKKRI